MTNKRMKGARYILCIHCGFDSKVWLELPALSPNITSRHSLKYRNLIHIIISHYTFYSTYHNMVFSILSVYPFDIVILLCGNNCIGTWLSGS